MLPQQLTVVARLLSSFVIVALAAPTFGPVIPPSYPLAVKNPYLNAWLPGNETTNLPFASAQFWNGLNLTWSVIARVDNQSYSLFGVPNLGPGVQAGFLQSAEYTSTHTTFTVNAGAASFVLDFLSPVSPQNYVRQSAPFSYLTISVSGINVASPDVQIYSDIDNTWAGQMSEYVSVGWGYSLTNSSTSVFTLTPGGNADYTELNDTAQWGTAVYCTRPSNGANLTAAVGNMDGIRASFAANGTASGPWQWAAESVVAYGQDLGSISNTTNVTYAIGYWRDPAINYLGSPRASYFSSICQTIDCGCVHVLDDFENADAEARSLDAQIASKAEAVAGSNYSDIVTLSVRQTFGGIDLTIPADTLDTNDTLAFVKEISSDGNVNTLDVIYPMSPLLYVMAPNYIRLLLEPVTRYLGSGRWPHVFAIHDVGNAYPNATGHDNGIAEQMPVEECGNLLTLAYMYQQATGDKNWASSYKYLFQGYADYLVANGLYSSIQLSSDDGLGNRTNQTGLAVKAAIALDAYGAMTQQHNYSNIGKRFATTLFQEGAGLDSKRTHFTAIQGNDSTWGMQYNLYSMLVTNLSTFPSEALSLQTKYYPGARSSAGVALDNMVNWGKTDWMIFAAAIAMAPNVSNAGVRDMFIDDVHAFMTNGLNQAPFSDRYFVYTNGSWISGGYNTYRARPVVAGHLGLLALAGKEQIRWGQGVSQKYSTRLSKRESLGAKLWKRFLNML